MGNIYDFRRVISFYVRSSRFTAIRFTDPHDTGLLPFRPSARRSEESYVHVTGNEWSVFNVLA
jgi:hypothetical protein